MGRVVCDFPRQVVDRARKKHEQIMALHDIIATHSFEKGRDAEVAAEARNLCAFATTLNDLIAARNANCFR